MQKNELKPIIEAVLFSMGDAVPLKTFAQALETSEKEIKEAMDEMMAEYASDERGIEIIELDGCYQMCTKENAYEYLIKIVQVPRNYRLTDVQLETLSIIAYKQPVTKAEIEKIRGVSSDHAVNRLLEAGLIEECGRLDTPGRPMIFATTREFLRRFGLSSTEALPDIDSEQVETFKIEAEEEIGYKEDAENAEESMIINTDDSQEYDDDPFAPIEDEDIQAQE